jgi:myosin heavy subunit
VRIRREGFPIRMPFREFYRNYSIFAAGRPKDEFPGPDNCKDDEQARDCCSKIAHMAIPVSEFQLGKTLIFMRDIGFRALDAQFRVLFEKCVVKLQSSGRAHLQAGKFRAIVARIVLCQAVVRKVAARTSFVVLLQQHRDALVLAKLQLEQQQLRDEEAAAVALKVKLEKEKEEIERQQLVAQENGKLERARTQALAEQVSKENESHLQEECGILEKTNISEQDKGVENSEKPKCTPIEETVTVLSETDKADSKADMAFNAKKDNSGPAFASSVPSPGAVQGPSNSNMIYILVAVLLVVLSIVIKLMLG